MRTLRGLAWGAPFLLLGLTGCGDDPSASAESDSDVPRFDARTELAPLSPEVLPPPPPDLSNRFADDSASALLGQRVFFDPGFSGTLLDEDNVGGAQTLGVTGESGKVACAGCHIPSAGFQDNRSARRTVSLASGWTRRRARSLLDVGQAKLLMWDGRQDALYNQPFEAIENPVDMNSSRLFVAEQIYARYRSEYEAIFGPIPIPLDDAARFPPLDAANTGCEMLLPDYTGALRTGARCHGMPGDEAEYDGLSSADQVEVTRVVVNVGKALGAYLRLLSCGPGRFDAWMQGDDAALDVSEQRGAALFAGRRADGSAVSDCSSCHSGPYFSDQSFHNVGLKPVGVGPASSFVDHDDPGALEGIRAILEDPLNVRGEFSDGDDGRLPDVAHPSSEGAFRTPSLRCVAERPSFMHTGQIGTLEEVVSFFARGGDTEGFLGTSENFIRDYSDEERADLVAFLRALSGPGPDAALLAPP